jgi:hypothetical protein
LISKIFKHSHIFSEKDFEPRRSHFSRVSPHDLRALPAELFTKPSFLVILGCRVDHENFAAYLLCALPDLSSENPEAM